jgi:hypothetical protein
MLLSILMFYEINETQMSLHLSIFGDSFGGFSTTLITAVAAFWIATACSSERAKASIFMV